ncbi:CLCA_X family protein [uncultured Ferrimonas sp.]|uniref:CLCA_X family protein n=1 Tax=uncultured Ferrimonas sp. TaxID=432640 RepID=UPI00262F605E|nr:CLCA_X family protein [uncultured Ferrimonas sp.]
MMQPKLNRLLQPHYRKGPDYRCGENVSFREVRDQFELAGVTIGRWVSRAEQQQAANLVFDAMADLAFILNVPPKVIGLRGQLQLAFGHGGSPTAQAHYAPGSRTLALAKNAGVGAFAHEWAHAFDNHIATKAFVHANTPIQFASHLWVRQRPMKPHPLNDALADFFDAVFVPAGEAHGAFLTNALALDKRMGRRYFSVPTELMARAFEAAIQRHDDIKNHYLVSGTQQSQLAKAGAYPSPAHVKEIQASLLRYFERLGQLL